MNYPGKNNSFSVTNFVRSCNTYLLALALATVNPLNFCSCWIFPPACRSIVCEIVGIGIWMDDAMNELSKYSGKYKCYQIDRYPKSELTNTIRRMMEKGD